MKLMASPSSSPAALKLSPPPTSIRGLDLTHTSFQRQWRNVIMCLIFDCRQHKNQTEKERHQLGTAQNLALAEGRISDRIGCIMHTESIKASLLLTEQKMLFCYPDEVFLGKVLLMSGSQLQTKFYTCSQMACSHLKPNSH